VRKQSVIFYLRRLEIITIARRKDVADTDDLDRFLICWFWHRPISADHDPIGALIGVALRMGKADLPEAEAKEIIKSSKQGRPLYKADDLGEYLHLTDAERTAWGIRTIGAVDISKRQRKQRRQQKARERFRRLRRAKGAHSQSLSLSRTKPWVAEGVSRRTWYRLQERFRRSQNKQEQADGKAIDDTLPAPRSIH
jgi:hypothetical protein